MKILPILLLLSLLFASCTTPPMSHRPPEPAPYTVTPLPLPYEARFPEDQIQVMGNGTIRIRRSQLHTRAQTYALHDLYAPNGTRLTLEGCDTFPIAWETDVGTWLLSTGQTAALYDENWKKLESLDRPMFAGYPLDGGRYYAVNDTYRQEYGFALGVDGENNPELYALYRYAQRLTDCVYTQIEGCEEGFRCYTDAERTTFVLYETNDGVPQPTADFSLEWDQRTGYYYYIDKTGQRIPGRRFTHAYPPHGSRAIAWTYDRAYLITFDP